MILLIETSNILVNKLTLIIQRNAQVPEQRDIADIVKSLIFNRVCECMQTQIDWRTFIWGGAFSGKDGSVNGIAASARNQEGFAIWAACVNCKDESMPRRHWKYYFGIRQRYDGALLASRKHVDPGTDLDLVRGRRFGIVLFLRLYLGSILFFLLPQPALALFDAPVEIVRRRSRRCDLRIFDLLLDVRHGLPGFVQAFVAEEPGRAERIFESTGGALDLRDVTPEAAAERLAADEAAAAAQRAQRVRGAAVSVWDDGADWWYDPGPAHQPVQPEEPEKPNEPNEPGKNGDDNGNGNDVGNDNDNGRDNGNDNGNGRGNDNDNDNGTAFVVAGS